MIETDDETPAQSEPRLRFHSRRKLREAWSRGLLDADVMNEAVVFMDELGVADGSAAVLEGEAWVDELQGWLDRMPSRYAGDSVRKMAQHAVRFYRWLVSKELAWVDVTEDLLAEYAEFRDAARRPGSWPQEECYLMALFDWLSDPQNLQRVYERSPWPMWKTGTRRRSRLRPGPPTLSSKVRMLDNEEWKWFRHVGVAGRAPGAERPLGSALPPRFPARDLALVDLMVTSGLRLSDVRLLLIDEIPQPPERQRERPWPNTMLFVGASRAKTRGGWVPFLPEVGDAIWSWWESPMRRAIVEAAQPNLRRQLRAGLLFVVDEVRDDRGLMTFSGEYLGRGVSYSANTLPREAAAAAVRLSGKRVEPLTIWQTDANGCAPLSDTSIRQGIFDEATLRVVSCEGHPFGPDLQRRQRRDDGDWAVLGGVQPHMLRHTAAVNWYVDLMLEVKRRLRDPDVVEAHSHLPSAGPFDPMFYVRKWLRHVDASTTMAYQTWVHRNDWPSGRGLGDGVRHLIVGGRW